MVAFHDCRLAKILAEPNGTKCTGLRYSMAGQIVMETLLRDLRQPEYIHVLLNPLPVYGLLVGWVGLVVALILRSRRAQIVTLILVLVSSASAWPVYEFGQRGYDRVLSMADESGQA